MDAMKLQYNIHHIKESFHPCFNQGLQKLLVQKGGVAHAWGGGWGERSIPSCNLINYRSFIIYNSSLQTLYDHNHCLSSCQQYDKVESFSTTSMH